MPDHKRGEDRLLGRFVVLDGGNEGGGERGGGGSGEE